VRGYAFGGWYREPACTHAWNFSADAVTANITLYAKWTINTYTVTFDSQGGSAVPGKTAVYYTTIPAPVLPSRAGYTFGGWYKDAGCTAAWSFATDRVLGNTTLYAKWTAYTYMVFVRFAGRQRGFFRPGRLQYFHRLAGDAHLRRLRLRRLVQGSRLHPALAVPHGQGDR